MPKSVRSKSAPRASVRPSLKAKATSVSIAKQTAQRLASNAAPVAVSARQPAASRAPQASAPRASGASSSTAIVARARTAPMEHEFDRGASNMQPNHKLGRGKWSTLHGGVPMLSSSGRKMMAGSAEGMAIGNGSRFRGMEFLSNIAVTTSMVTGSALYNIALNPTLFGYRLPQLVRPFAKFWFNGIRIHYLATIAEDVTGSSGCVYVGVNKDPDAPLPTGTDAIPAMATWFPNVDVTAYYDDLELSTCLLHDGPQMPLFIDAVGDQRFGAQGNLLVITGSLPSANVSIGQLFIEYDVSCFEVNTAEAPTGSVIMYVNALPASATNVQLFQQYEGVAAPPTDGSNTSFSSAYGDQTLIQVVNPATYGGNVMFNFGGTYLIDFLYEMNLTSATVLQPPVPTIATGTAAFRSLSYLGSGTGANAYLNWITESGATGVTYNSNCNYAGVFAAGGTGSALFRYVLAVTAGTVANFQGPAMSGTGTLTANGQFLCCRLSPDIGGYVANTGRPTPQQITLDTATARGRAAADQNMREADSQNIDDATRLIFVSECLAAPPEETLYVNAMIDCFSLPMPHRPETPTVTMFHPVIGVALWLVQRFGPLIAAKLLGMAEAKLKAWLKARK
jgi:hypothetical protein